MTVKIRLELTYAQNVGQGYPKKEIQVKELNRIPAQYDNLILKNSNGERISFCVHEVYFDLDERNPYDATCFLHESSVKSQHSDLLETQGCAGYASLGLFAAQREDQATVQGLMHYMSQYPSDMLVVTNSEDGRGLGLNCRAKGDTLFLSIDPVE